MSEITDTPNRQILKQGDTWPPFPIAVDADFTEATQLELVLEGPVTIRGEATALPEHGRAEYRWADGDTERPGDYVGELRVSWPDRGIQYLPLHDSMRLTILPRGEAADAR